MSPLVEYEATPIAQKVPPSPQKGARPRILFFGNFGVENLGNECTLQSILQNTRRLLPGSALSVVSCDVSDTTQRHHVPAFAVSRQTFTGVVPRKGVWGRIAKAGRICKRVPAEIADWLYSIDTLRGADMIVMTGTGMLTDYMTTATGFPYDVFRWSAAARLAGCKVRFVGVGVGPIYGKASRWLITKALSFADYRSFRDETSRNRIAANGFDSQGDPLCPDLVFSLATQSLPQSSAGKHGPVRVGLGVMDFRDIHRWTAEQHAVQYSTYLEKMSDFVIWLIEHNYAVRILQGDARHDASPRAELRNKLKLRGIHYEQAGIIDQGSTGVEELAAEISQVDIVVSPRFHTLLLGMMLNIPCVSISYDSKNDCLLQGVGLGEYRQEISELDLNKLIGQFTNLESRLDQVRPHIQEKAAEYRQLLNLQYDRIFREFKCNT